MNLRLFISVVIKELISKKILNRSIISRWLEDQGMPYPPRLIEVAIVLS